MTDEDTRELWRLINLLGIALPGARIELTKQINAMMYTFVRIRPPRSEEDRLCAACVHCDICDEQRVYESATFCERYREPNALPNGIAKVIRCGVAALEAQRSNDLSRSATDVALREALGALSASERALAGIAQTTETNPLERSIAESGARIRERATVECEDDPEEEVEA